MPRQMNIDGRERPGLSSATNPVFIGQRRRLLGRAALGVLGGLLIASNSGPVHAAVSTKPSSALATILSAWVPGARPASSGSLTWLGLKVYDAHLWTGAQGLDATQWKGTPFALELHYLRGLKGKLIAERSAAEIEKLGLGSAAQRTDWLNVMVGLFPDVNKNDRLVGVFLPAKGIVFLHNDKVIGKVDDAEFAEAFLAIWFDAKTSAPTLRQALLTGQKSGS